MTKIDGVLLLDKPFGLSSHAALQHARRLLSAEKAGHTGTLDPQATGLLPLCFGEATKFSQQGLESKKAYLATICFGKVSTTYDGEGKITETGASPSPVDVETALPHFLGQILQIPPMYSALKYAGRPLYYYARAGSEVDRALRQTSIDVLEVVSYVDSILVVRVLCAKGTYIRVLAHDLGQVLGCGAYLAGLRRLGVGPFSIEAAVDLDTLASMSMAQRESRLLPVDCLVQELAPLDLSREQTTCLQKGMAIPCLHDREKQSALLRLYGLDSFKHNRTFIGVGQLTACGMLRPKRLLASSPV